MYGKMMVDNSDHLVSGEFVEFVLRQSWQIWETHFEMFSETLEEMHVRFLDFFTEQAGDFSKTLNLLFISVSAPSKKYVTSNLLL